MTTSPPSGSDHAGGADRRSEAFDLLHPSVQRWVWQQGWTTLRDAQEAAIRPILEGNSDVLISAATASGKTEAAFLPICSRLVAEGTPPDGGVAVLYLSPLKALINDQFERLDQLCEHLELSVHRWHGDVASSRKAQVLRQPSGVLLITPESLEAIFVIHGPRVASLLASLRYVVVDELHSFIGTERGAQLQSLLQRVELALRRRVPRIGLSATLGDLRLAAEFLRPGHGQNVSVITSLEDNQELRLQLRGYLVTEPRVDARSAAAAGTAGQEIVTEDLTEGDKLAISGDLYKTLRGTDNLVFANSRRNVEVYADLLRRLSEKHRAPNEFWPHHGSLSKEIREDVEAALRDRTRPVNAVCTSTLEMGIDIGTVTSIAQIGAPPSVCGLRQRLGRSGRRGDPAVLRIYVSEHEVTERTPPPDALRAELVQSIAMVRLLLDRWFEPPTPGNLHVSTLVQQLLSLIAQHGGVLPVEAHRALCAAGPFAGVDDRRFDALLRSLGAADLVVQADDGTLLLGSTGERIVNHYSFFAAFVTPEEYRLVHEGRTLGTIPIHYPLFEGALLIFGGRRWRVLSVDTHHKVVDLTRAAGGRPPLFNGTGIPVDDHVRQEMLAVYKGGDIPSFLDATARSLLVEARENFLRYRLDQSFLLIWGADTLIFPWAGDRIMGTLALALAANGLDVSLDGLALAALKTSEAEVQAQLVGLASKPPPDASSLAAKAANKAQEKYDWVLGDDLLCDSFAARSLDPERAWRCLHQLLAKGADDGGGVNVVHDPSAPEEMLKATNQRPYRTQPRGKK